MRQEASEIAQEGDVPITQSRGDSAAGYRSLDLSCPCRARVFTVWYPDRHCWKVEPSGCSPCHMGQTDPHRQEWAPALSPLLCSPDMV